MLFIVLLYGDVMEFELFKTKYKIDFSFFVILSLALLFDSKAILYLLLFSALHEFAHIILLYSLGGRADRICTSYYGIGMKYSSAVSFKNEIIILSAGIILNLFFALINVQRQINFALFVINVLPIYPLDGGRIIKLVAERIFDYNLSYKICFIISILFFILITIYGIYKKNFNILLICVYLLTWIVRGTYD